MRKFLKNILLLVCIFLPISWSISDVITLGAETEKSVSEKNTDVNQVTPGSEYVDLRDEVDTFRQEGKTYLFTGKSAGKNIPVQIHTDAIMVYWFSSKDVKLLDGKNKEVIGRTDDEGLGEECIKYERYINEEGEEAIHITSTPRMLITVKRGESYYFSIPQNVPDGGYEVYAVLFPKSVKKLENGKLYMLEGTGKYVYYPFTIKKKSLTGIFIDGVFISYGGGDTMYFKVQKKVAGKWKDITSVQSKLGSLGQCGNTAPYGLSAGKYRYGVKLKKKQFAYINVDIRKANYKSAVSKNKALSLKKGKAKNGLLTWNDKKSHWYKISKTDKNKVKKLTMYAGGAIDKTRFTIYKKGAARPLKIVDIRSKVRTNFSFLTYVSKTYTLEENGTYYIKVSKAKKKTNGAYKLQVK